MSTMPPEQPAAPPPPPPPPAHGYTGLVRSLDGASSAVSSSTSARNSSTELDGFVAELGVLDGHRRRIVAREAGAAQLRLRPLRRLDEAVVRDVRERCRTDVLAHAFDGLVVRDQLVGIREVDAVEALSDDGRRRDANV